MADENEDPREVAWHPRHAAQLVGHQQAAETFYTAFDAAKPHHAWLLNGPKGIGKATLAYRLAAHILGQKNQHQTTRWIEARSHPDLFVLERKLGDTKPRKLKSEISVEDARGLSDFFSHSSSGMWRVGLVDAADDLNTASANALLKLVEEPPPNCILLLVCHQPGKLLKTMKSRCLRLPISNLTTAETMNVLNNLPLENKVSSEEFEQAANLAFGSPGRALTLLSSDAAKAFTAFLNVQRNRPQALLAIGNYFSGRNSGIDDFNVFGELLLDWVAEKAKQTDVTELAKAHAKIAENFRIANAFNLDRRQAVISAVNLVQESLKQT
jgi:DNA polymerase III subunit delta'